VEGAEVRGCNRRDEEQRESNLAKHGVDFLCAILTGRRGWIPWLFLTVERRIAAPLSSPQTVQTTLTPMRPCQPEKPGAMLSR
jgi:hypothetical protein